MIVIHIGLPKSGSTSIQTFLAANDGALRRLSIDYPRVGRGARKQHLNIAHELKGITDKSEADFGGLAELARHICNSKYDLTIFSSEIFETAPAKGIQELKRKLDRSNEAFRVVLVIRELLHLIPSSYAQKVRHGVNTFDFDRFFDLRIKELRISYFQTARRWADVFGWENLRVRLLDSRHLLNGDLIDDFLDVAGIDPSVPRIRSLPRRGPSNEASDWRVLEAMRGFFAQPSILDEQHALSRVFRRSDRKFDRRCIELAARDAGDAMGWTSDKGRYLDQSQARRCVDIYAEAICNLNKFLPRPLPDPLGLEEAGFVNREFLPELARIDEGERRTFFDLIAENLLHLM